MARTLPLYLLGHEAGVSPPASFQKSRTQRISRTELTSGAFGGRWERRPAGSGAGETPAPAFEASRARTASAGRAKIRRRVDLLLSWGQIADAEEAVRYLLRAAIGDGDPHTRGCAHVDLAKVHRAGQRPDLALVDTLKALRCLDRRRDPDTFDRAVYDLSRDFTHIHQVKPRFARLLREIRQQRHRPSSVAWGQLRWLEGLVFLSQNTPGSLKRSASAIGGARRCFLKLRAARPAALVTLDLVDVCRKLDRDRTARLAVRETLKLLAADGTPAAALEAFRSYAEALAGDRPLAEPEAAVRVALLSPDVEVN